MIFNNDVCLFFEQSQAEEIHTLEAKPDVHKAAQATNEKFATQTETAEAWRDIMEKDKGSLAGQPKLREVPSAGESKEAVSAFTFP